LQVKEEKVEMIVSDSDDLAQKGIFSDNQGSDDNDDDLDEGITVKSLNDVKWTPVLEVKLEELLIEKQFDFNRAALDFSALLNKDLATCFSEFRIDAKALQLKWTDIEIRRYIMP
jgi:hypothetical protein